MKLQCPSYLDTSNGERQLSLSLNAIDYTALSPGFTFYADPPLAVFSRPLEPTGGILEGGTRVTIHGSGFDVLPDSGAAFARCRWQSIFNSTLETAAAEVSASAIVCTSPALPQGVHSVSIALNGQSFLLTGLEFTVFRQPSEFTFVTLNTTDLGIEIQRDYGTAVGAPLGANALVWLRGGGFLAFENSSVPIEERRLLCRWGDALTTRPTRVEADLVICPAAQLAKPSKVQFHGIFTPPCTPPSILPPRPHTHRTCIPTFLPPQVSLYIAINGIDFVDTGMTFRAYAQPAVFGRQLAPNATSHCATFFDARCATVLYPTGGVEGGGTSVTLFGHGFAAFDGRAALAACEWGGAAITTPTRLTDTEIVCPSAAAQPPPSTNTHVALRISLNGVHFVDTNLTFTLYAQPTSFLSLAPLGGPLDARTVVTLTGASFTAFSAATGANSTTSAASKARCRWESDVDSAGAASTASLDGSTHDTVALELDHDRIVCPVRGARCAPPHLHTSTTPATHLHALRPHLH